MSGLRPEAKFQKQVRKFLDSLPNTWYYVPETGGRRAIPDVIASIGGKFVALELKKSKAEADKKTGRIVLQKHNLTEITRCGGHAYLVYPECWDDTKEVLTNLAKDKSYHYYSN